MKLGLSIMAYIENNNCDLDFSKEFQEKDKIDKWFQIQWISQ